MTGMLSTPSVRKKKVSLMFTVELDSVITTARQDKDMRVFLLSAPFL